MIPLGCFAGQRVALLGLGRSGQATAQALLQAKADVCAWDDSAPARDQAAQNNIPLTHLTTIDWSTNQPLF